MSVGHGEDAVVRTREEAVERTPLMKSNRLTTLVAKLKKRKVDDRHKMREFGEKEKETINLLNYG